MGVSLRKVTTHVVVCPDYAQLYREDPARALSPEDEYNRWKVEDHSPEARAERKDQKQQDMWVKLDRSRDASDKRWATPPDILE